MSDTNNRHDNVASASSTANRDLTLRAMTLGDLQDVARVFDEVWPQAAPLTGTPMAYELARYFVLEYMRSATASFARSATKRVFLNSAFVPWACTMKEEPGPMCASQAIPDIPS